MNDLVNRIGPAAWRRIDAAVAGALLLSLTTPVLLGHPERSDPVAAILAFGAAATLPLAVRRRRPLAVLAVITAATVAAEILEIRFTPFASNTGPSIGLAMYTVAAQCGRRTSLRALGLVSAASFASAWIVTYTQPEEDHNAVHVIAAVLGWLVGDAVRAHRAHRAERLRRAVAEERLNISREVHDVISHNLSVIAVRSGVGRMVFDTRPQDAREALAEIERVSRGALTELRALLDTVRDRASLTPAPRLDDLPKLVEQMTAAGVEVSLERRGVSPAFRPTLEQAAYRIVQEALTNVVKHAGPTRAGVVVEYRDAALLIEITNEGGTDRHPRPAAPGDGWGLVGIRERAALFGGTMTAGPRPGGGFRVSVRLPLTEDGHR